MQSSTTREAPAESHLKAIYTGLFVIVSDGVVASVASRAKLLNSVMLQTK
jgi:hypothetical protein